MIGNKNGIQTILLTGAAGFLGSEIIKKLSTDYNFIALVRDKDNIPRLDGIRNELQIYSVSEELNRAFSENCIDCIIHTATSYGRKQESYEDVLNTNFLMPVELLHKAIQNNVQTFINADTVLDRFVNIYSLTKRHFCEWLKFLSGQITVVNLQLEHFYGPGSSTDNFIFQTTLKMLNNEEEILLTAGEQVRDFIYIDDAVQAFGQILRERNKLIESFNDFEVASGERITIKELVETIKDLTGSSSTLRFGALPYRTNELMFSESDNSALIEKGWKPETLLKDGLKKLISSLRR